MKTNQKSLKHLLEQREIHSDYQKLVMKVIGFDFVIEYNPGKNKLVADALSRIPYFVMELGVLLSSNGTDWGLLQEEVKKDATLTRVRHGVEKGEQIPLGFDLVNDLLFIKGRCVLAKSSPFISVLLREHHTSPLEDMRVWERMRRQVTRFVREYHICQQAKASYQSLVGLLQNLPIPTHA